MMTAFAESVVEKTAFDWLDGLGYPILHGSEIVPGELWAERAGYDPATLASLVKQEGSGA